MMARSVFLVSLCAAVLLICGRTTGAVPQKQTPVELGREWLDAVRTHRPGANDEAATRIAAWSSAELESAMWYLASLDRSEIDKVAVPAATLHADIAMWQWDAQQGLVRPPPVSGARGTGGEVVVVIDGTYAGIASVGLHWSFARRVIDRMSNPAGVDLVRLWYRASVAYLLGSNSFTEGLPHVRRARQLFGRDPFFWFANGCAAEAFASRRIQEVARSLAATADSRVNVSSAGDHLRDAEAWFRRALELDPAFVRARLRLGRVLAMRGESRAAVRQFEEVLARSTESTVRYYAYMFLGERREAVRQFAQARDAYAEAARLFPHAQSALLALGQVARRSGDRATARRIAATLAELPELSHDRDDPWWRYEIGVGEEMEAFQAELHAALAKGPR